MIMTGQALTQAQPHRRLVAFRDRLRRSAGSWVWAGAAGRGQGWQQPPVLVSGQRGAEALAVDASHLYWTAIGEGVIYEANLDGTNPQAIVSGQSGPWGVTVDASQLYWTNPVPLLAVISRTTAAFPSVKHSGVVTAGWLEMISTDTQVMHGQAVIAGTRVPVSAIPQSR
ncbi:MAG TPA: DUF433 domain-containing protein [Gemmatimonadales bacterium]|jgi:hypothetical protein|nr:DUF433 domain-containing protein [Gemmatimonadales bacterium]